MRKWTVRAAGLAASVWSWAPSWCRPGPLSRRRARSPARSTTTRRPHTPRTAVQKITVAAAGTIAVGLDWADSSARLSLILKDPSDNKVASVFSPAKPKTLTYEATVTGVYKVLVLASVGASTYTVSVDYPGPPPVPQAIADLRRDVRLLGPRGHVRLRHGLGPDRRQHHRGRLLELPRPPLRRHGHERPRRVDLRPRRPRRRHHGPLRRGDGPVRPRP